MLTLIVKLVKININIIITNAMLTKFILNKLKIKMQSYIAYILKSE